MIDLIKESTVAFAQWQKQSPVQDADQADAIKQDFEDQVRNEQEIAEATSSPLALSDAFDDVNLTDSNLEKELDDLEDFSFRAFVSPRVSQEYDANHMSPVMEELSQTGSKSS
eukprot:2043844-Rhodomonas_salina.1